MENNTDYLDKDGESIVEGFYFTNLGNLTHVQGGEESSWVYETVNGRAHPLSPVLSSSFERIANIEDYVSQQEKEMMFIEKHELSSPLGTEEDECPHTKIYPIFEPVIDKDKKSSQSSPSGMIDFLDRYDQVGAEVREGAKTRGPLGIDSKVVGPNL